jgi:hypothetical protein
MFPKAPLPNRPFAARLTNGIAKLVVWQTPREPCLDQSPAHRKIRVVGRKRPNRVNVIREDCDCVNRERKARSRPLNGVSQQVNVINKQAGSTVVQIDRKEPASAGD